MEKLVWGEGRVTSLAKGQADLVSGGGAKSAGEGLWLAVAGSMSRVGGEKVGGGGGGDLGIEPREVLRDSGALAEELGAAFGHAGQRLRGGRSRRVKQKCQLR